MPETTNALYWYNELNILFVKLPAPGEMWTADYRKRWLYALEKVLDLLISVIEDEEVKHIRAVKLWRGEI